MKKMVIRILILSMLAGASYGAYLLYIQYMPKKKVNETSNFIKRNKPDSVRINTIRTKKYIGMKNRDPFTNPEQTEVYKDAILAEYTLNDIVLLGVVREGDRAWAILAPRPSKDSKDEDMNTYKAELNAKVSRSGAVLDRINEHNIRLTKSIKTSSGIKKRHIELTIGAPKQ